MKAWRISSPSLTVMIAVLFITQLQMQNIPRIAIYHASDDTECTCGCTEQESTHEENVCCVPGAGMLVCICDDDHYKRAELAPLQLIDLLFTSHNSVVIYFTKQEFVTSFITKLQSLDPHRVFRPPQV